MPAKLLLSLAAGIALMSVPFLAQTALADKVVICHAAGLNTTTHYVTLNIDEHAVYGPAGHFLENGTPAAGHEQDYFGPCLSPDTATPLPTDTPTTPPQGDPDPTNTPNPTNTPPPTATGVPPTATAVPPTATNPPTGLFVAPTPTARPAAPQPTARPSSQPFTLPKTGDGGLK